MWEFIPGALNNPSSTVLPVQRVLTLRLTTSLWKISHLVSVQILALLTWTRSTPKSQLTELAFGVNCVKIEEFTLVTNSKYCFPPLQCLWRQVSFMPSFITGSSGLLFELLKKKKVNTIFVLQIFFYFISKIVFWFGCRSSPEDLCYLLSYACTALSL